MWLIGCLIVKNITRDKFQQEKNKWGRNSFYGNLTRVSRFDFAKFLSDIPIFTEKIMSPFTRTDVSSVNEHPSVLYKNRIEAKRSKATLAQNFPSVKITRDQSRYGSIGFDVFYFSWIEIWPVYCLWHFFIWKSNFAIVIFSIAVSRIVSIGNTIEADSFFSFLLHEIT